MTPSTTGDPLPGDPRRQADATLRAYSYQILRTIEAWLNLKQEQILFVECAEDFDTIGSGTAVATQVKYSQSSFSLATEDAKSAINHYWELRARAGPCIKFVFLTRAAVAIERPAILKGYTGVSLWRKAALGDSSAAESLRSYLSAVFEGNDSLRDFLHASTSEELIHALVQPVEWLTDEPDSAEIVENIRRGLVHHGELGGYAPSTSASALPRLYFHCWEVAQRKEAGQRKLTREDFLLAFDEATSVRIPLKSGSLEELISKLLIPQELPISVSLSPHPWLSEVPPLPVPVVARAQVVEPVLTALGQGKTVILAGTVGKGKTTIAKLVLMQSRSKSLWIGLSGRNLDFAERAIWAAGSFIEQSGTGYLIVVDDIDLEAAFPQPLWTSLAKLYRASRTSACGLLLTTQGIPKERLDSRILSIDPSIHTVPDLDEDEIKGLLRDLGCPDDGRLGQWSAIARMHTSGHPKLVHVFALDLRDKGWPSPSPKDILSPPASVQGQRTGERLIATKSLDPVQLDYLYLLSMTGGLFSREFALNLGQRMPRLREPGTVLDSFVGRWIESEGGDIFRVTSLLAKEAERAWPEEKVRHAHVDLFDCYFSSRKIDVSNVLEIFLHAFAGKDGQRLSRYVVGLVRCPENAQPHVMRELRSLVYVARGAGERAVPFDATASRLVRLLQFRIASQEMPGELERICSQWSWEIDQEREGEARDRERLLWALSVAINLTDSIPPGIIMQALAVVQKMTTAGRPRLRLPELPLILRPDSQTDQEGDLLAFLFSIFDFRCKSIGYLETLLNALLNVEGGLRKRMLAAAELPVFQGSFMVDAAWVGESQKEQPDWVRVLAVMQRVSALAREWGAHRLGLSAARAASIVHDEYLNDRTSALSAIEEGQKQFGASEFLEAQLGNIHFRHGEYAKALAVWKHCLAFDTGSAGNRLTDPMLFRKAALAAAQESDLELSAELFTLAAHWSERVGLAGLRPGFLFDASLVSFRSGTFDLMDESLLEAVRGIQGHPDPERDFRAFARQKLGGHVTLWILEQLRGHGLHNRLQEPPVGLCSNPDLHHGIKKLPASPCELSIAHLVEIEHRLRRRVRAIEAFSPVIESCQIPAMRMIIGMVSIEQTFRSTDFAPLLRLLVSYREEYWRSRAQTRLGQSIVQAFHGQTEQKDRQGEAGAQYFLICALTVHRLGGGSTDTLFDAWRSSVPPSDTMSDALRQIREGIGVPFEKARMVLTNKNADAYERLCAAHVILSSPPENPKLTAFAQIALLAWMFPSPARDALVESIGRLSAAYSKHWQVYIQQPALLAMPRISVPTLREALSMPLDGARKLVALVEAASFASGVNVPADLMQWLRTILEETASGVYRTPGSSE